RDNFRRGASLSFQGPSQDFFGLSEQTAPAWRRPISRPRAGGLGGKRIFDLCEQVQSDLGPAEEAAPAVAAGPSQGARTAAHGLFKADCSTRAKGGAAFLYDSTKSPLADPASDSPSFCLPLRPQGVFRRHSPARREWKKGDLDRRPWAKEKARRPFPANPHPYFVGWATSSRPTLRLHQSRFGWASKTRPTLRLNHLF